MRPSWSCHARHRCRPAAEALTVVGLLAALCAFCPAAWAGPDGAGSGNSSPEHPPQGPPDIDLQDLVISAMKTKVKVQEAPAIVTVLTDQRVKSQGFRFLSEALASVPGFIDYQVWYGFGSSHFPVTRGMLVGPLVLRDGLDLFDASLGTPNLRPESFPLQTMQRIEVISGPGGVMWGSNALVGVVNIVSKTADDLDGVEAYAGFGSGPGRPETFKTYAMAGTKLFDDRLKVFVHVSYDTWREASHEPALQPIIRSTASFPQAPALLVGPWEPAEGRRSHQLLFSGNAQAGGAFLHWSLPWGWYYSSVLNPGTALHETLPEDGIDCTNPANAAACARRVDPDRLSRYLLRRDEDRQVLVGYRKQLLRNALTLTGRAFFTEYVRRWSPWVIAVPNQLLPGGVSGSYDFTSLRAGANFDAEAALSRVKLLFGGELFYDYLPEHTVFYLTDPSQLPFPCPPDRGGMRCPLVMNLESDRITSGFFLNAQTRILPTLVLDAGGRLQVYGGKRRLDPVALFSGAVVWNLAPGWNLKANYAEGFRPPALTRVDSTVLGMKLSGNPDIQNERSRALQGEINARLLRDFKPFRQLAFRLDYAHTWISNFIDVRQGVYANTPDIGIHSVEFLAQLTMMGGHWFSLGYSFLDVATADRGKLRTIPNQWLTMQALINIWRQRLFVSSQLTVMGSAEDPNRYLAHPAGEIALGDVDASGQPSATPAFTANATDITFDRIRPVALWNAGIRYVVPSAGLRFAFDIYNLIDARGYHPGEGFMDYTVNLEMVPNLRERFSFMFSGELTY